MSDDELALPQVPEAKPDDPEDVSWALSTAEAMWARGDHAEGIKWVRRAAEAAGEAEDDMRALELAKGAADLAGLLARQSRESIEVEPAPAAPAGAPAPGPAPEAKPAPEPKPESVAPRPPPSAPPTPRAASASSAPPIALPSQAARGAAPRAPAPLRVTAPPAPAKTTIPRPPPASADVDSTIVATVQDLMAEAKKRSTDEWDASPTQSLSDAELSQMNDSDRKTSLGAPPPRPPAASLHDPEIRTSQAVRVVVWRDANGVHVAPAGTVVSAITVDAVLVALEPSADLTAWLSERSR